MQKTETISNVSFTQIGVARDISKQYHVEICWKNKKRNTLLCIPHNTMLFNITSSVHEFKIYCTSLFILFKQFHIQFLFRIQFNSTIIRTVII